MQAELTASGFQDLHSAEAVENAMKAEGTTLVVVNSVWLRCKKCTSRS
jgi:putative YphP/YqiW family bacilliredoxin